METVYGEAGEKVELDVSITNKGNELLTDVSAVIKTSESAIAINDDEVTFWPFDAGETRQAADDFELTVSQGFEDTVTFELEIYYRIGDYSSPLLIDSASFDIEVFAGGSEPQFSIGAISFADDDLTEADGDGILESGEDDVYASIELINTGNAPASNVMGVITSQPVELPELWRNDDADYPDIPAAGSAIPTGIPFRIDDIPTNFSGTVNQILTVYHGVDHEFSQEIPFSLTIEPTPRIRVLSDYYAFGLVSPGTIVPHDFEVENIGSATANIGAVSTSHPDLTFPSHPTSIAPGQTATFSAIFDTTGLDASIVRSFSINSDAHFVVR